MSTVDEAIEMLRSMSAGARYHGDEEVANKAQRCAAAVEELQKQNEQAWERAALEARRVLRNGSKARKLERLVEERDKEIGRLREQVEVTEHRARNLADEVGTVREINTGLRMENQALRAEEE